MKLKNLLVTGLVLTLLVATGGCIFSPEDEPDPGPPSGPELKYPSSYDILIENFEIIYEGMMIDEFRDMLHPQYRTILLQDTMDEWAGSDAPLTEEYFTRDEEIAIHQNIFGGNSGVKPNGDSVAPVSAIDVVYLDKPGTWELIENSDPDFAGYGGYYATFNVLIYFQTSSVRFDVAQEVQIYAAPVDDNGREKWLLLGQRGQAISK